MNDTIAALATAPGQGGIAIVRMSGPESGRILGEIFQPASGKHPLKSHLLTYGHLMGEGGERVDECMAVMMYAPRSYTREDVAELQLHGGVCNYAMGRGRVLQSPGNSPAGPLRMAALTWRRPRR